MAVPDLICCAPPINARARATGVFKALFCPPWFTECEFRPSGPGRWRLVAQDRPYSWRRRVRRNLSRLAPGNPLAPRINRGDGAPMGASCSVSHAPFPMRGASRRAIATSIRRRAALSDVPFRLASGSKLRPLLGGRVFRASGKPHGPPSASSSRGVVVPPGGTPAPPECRRSVRLLPAGAASDPAITTPHESALGGSDTRIINPPKRARISLRSSFVLLWRRRNSVTLLAAAARHSLWSWAARA